MRQGPLVVEILRGQSIESQHLVDAVVMDAQGKIVQTYGDTQRMIFPRSAIKFAQALALLESGAADKFELSQKRISLACASHLGEKFHTQEVQEWLQEMDLTPAAFECGPHLPFDEDTMQEMIRQSQKPTAIHNNCSGKHCGMLTTAKFYGENTHGYIKHDHPVQMRLRKILSEVGECDYDRAPWGIDGCGIPTYAVPLDRLAHTMTAFLPNSRVAGKNSTRKLATQKIINAVIAEPLMISGTKGLCSNVVSLSRGKAIAKTGAEGVYTGIIPELGLSIALKAQDGASRAAETAILHLLKVHRGITELQEQELLPFTPAVIKNWAGEIVGSMKVHST